MKKINLLLNSSTLHFLKTDSKVCTILLTFSTLGLS